MAVVVFVATHWGTRHGGLNALNQDLVHAVAHRAGTDVAVACAVTRPLQHEITHEAKVHDVTLLDLGSVDPECELGPAGEALVRSWGRVDWFVGHDLVSGGFATEAASLTGARSAVVLHTDYGAYASFRGTIGEEIHERARLTGVVLNRADVVLAVGPKLARAARDHVDGSKEVFRLIPGLVDRPRRSAQPENFHAITSGRLTAVDDRLKQGSLAVEAFGRLLGTVPELARPDARISVVGVEDGREKELRRRAEKAAGRLVAVNCRGYVEDRDQVLGLLKSASVCLMLSVHDGFGLTGWEALAAEVPLVLSKNTGLYELLDEAGGEARGCVRVVDVQGALAEPYYTPADVETVTAALRGIAHRGGKAKEDARALRRRVAEYTWPGAARALLTALGLAEQTSPSQRPSLDPRSRFLNPPPPVVPYVLRDRRPERAAVRARLLRRDRRATALVGPRGVGKTALVSQLMTDLAESPAAGGFGRLDYLSASGHLAVTGPRLIEHLRLMASAEVERVPGELDPTVSPDWYERVEDVLRLLKRDVLVVLDQVEDLLDGEGTFQDRGLQRLVCELAGRTDHRVSMLLVSARPLHPSLLGGGPEPIPIGLTAEPTAPLELMHDIADPLPGELVFEGGRAVQLTGWHPRNVELLIAAFSLDPGLRVADLDGLAGSPPTRCAAVLTDRVLERLPEEWLTVARALAVLGLPSPASAVTTFLEDILPAPAVGSALAELSRIRFVRSVDGAYDLPPAEAQQVLQAWWAGKLGEQARRSFLKRAAEHFGEQRQEGEPLTVEQLAPHFREIRLRLDLGDVKQVRNALELMAALDSAYLRRWGHQHVLGPWRRQLLDREVGTHYWRGNLSALAAGALELDETEEALTHLQQALAAVPTPPASEDGDVRARVDRLDLLNQASGAYWRDGRLHDAERLYQEQLQLTRFAPGHATARALLGLAACAGDLGEVGSTADHLRAAEALTRHVGDSRGRDLHARVLLARAELARLDRDDSEAIALAGAASEAGGPGNVEIEIRALDIQAGVQLDRGDFAAAVRLAEGASAAASRTGVSDITRSAHATLALAYLALNRAEDALSAAAAAVRFFPSKRALVGTVVLGLAHVRNATLGDAHRAFSEVGRLAERYRPDDGRPYWVWDALAVAEAGRYVCDGGDTAAEERSIEAYLRARDIAPQPGVRRRCLLFLDLLDTPGGPDLAGLRAAADRTPAEGRTVDR